jgi:PTS system galactitol-specific IIA component
MSDTLASTINPEAIALGVTASTGEEVIRLLAGRLEKLGYVRPTYADAVVAREAKMPTGLPVGRDANVAVPHTDPQHVIRPGVAVATLARPVAFASMEDPDEDVPVGLVFMLAINDKDRQIDMLQQIMETIQSPEKIDALMRTAETRDVFEILGQ